MINFITTYYMQALLGISLSLCSILLWGVISLFMGVRSLLRNQIIANYNHYIPQKYIPIYAMENVYEMYKAYHRLGGNGTITKLVNELECLPSYPNGNQ